MLPSFPGAQTPVEAQGHIGHGSVLHGCVVRRDAMVGMNAVVMDNAEIGERAMVAACPFAPGGIKVPARSLVAGVPAKVKRLLTEDELSRKHKGTLTYQDLAWRSLASLRKAEPLAKLEAGRVRTKT